MLARLPPKAFSTISRAFSPSPPHSQRCSRSNLSRSALGRVHRTNRTRKMRDDAIQGIGADFDRRKMLLALLMAATAGATFACQPRRRIDYLGSGKLDEL